MFGTTSVWESSSFPSFVFSCGSRRSAHIRHARRPFRVNTFLISGLPLSSAVSGPRVSPRLHSGHSPLVCRRRAPGQSPPVRIGGVCFPQWNALPFVYRRYRHRAPGQSPPVQWAFPFVSRRRAPGQSPPVRIGGVCFPQWNALPFVYRRRGDGTLSGSHCVREIFHLSSGCVFCLLWWRLHGLFLGCLILRSR